MIPLYWWLFSELMMYRTIRQMPRGDPMGHLSGKGRLFQSEFEADSDTNPSARCNIGRNVCVICMDVDIHVVPCLELCTKRGGKTELRTDAVINVKHAHLGVSIYPHICGRHEEIPRSDENRDYGRTWRGIRN